MNNDLLSQICSQYYVYTYIHHVHIWHRNKLSRCQLKLLVSCSDDEHQTSLKWDRSSHPVAPECCVSHTLHLKMFTINVLRFCVSCSFWLNVPLSGTRGVISDVDYPDGFPKKQIFLHKPNHSSLGLPSPLCILQLTRQIHIEWQSKHKYVFVIYKVLVYVQTSQPTTCFGLFQLGHLQVGHKGQRKYTIMQEYH